MKKLLYFSAIGMFAASSALSAASLKTTKVIHGMVRQCEYVNGVTIRLLASRECPTFESISPSKPTSLPPPPNDEPNQQAFVPSSSSPPTFAQVPPKNSEIVTDDIILEKSINRCKVIGFTKDTSEYRSCVIDQIKILSK